MTQPLTILDLFSGIGGFSYAAERLVGGFKTVAFCEPDGACQRVLNKHWPSTPIFPDVRTLSAEAVKELCPNGLSLITAGFPCQDLSCAGKQLGYDGERSVLFYEIIRLARELRPNFLLLENVRNLLSHKDGETFQETLFQIAKAGYDAEWSVIPASDLGACHRRERIWIVCSRRAAYSSQLLSNGGKIGHGWEFGSQSQSKLGDSDCKDNASHANDEGLQGQRAEYELSEGSGQGTAPWRSGGAMLSPEWRSYLSKPVLCRGDDGLSGKLDILGGLIYEASSSEGFSKACQLGQQVLRDLWKHQSASAPSSHVLPRGYSDSVPTMPHGIACQGGDLGQWSKGSQQVFEGLRDLWHSLSGETFQNWQDMFVCLSQRAWEIKRQQKVAFKGRTDRLKQLGNSIVPQVAAVPLRRIKELAQSNGKEL